MCFRKKKNEEKSYLSAAHKSMQRHFDLRSQDTSQPAVVSTKVLHTFSCSICSQYTHHPQARAAACSLPSTAHKYALCHIRYVCACACSSYMSLEVNRFSLTQALAQYCTVTVSEQFANWQTRQQTHNFCIGTHNRFRSTTAPPPPLQTYVAVAMIKFTSIRCWV